MTFLYFFLITHYIKTTKYILKLISIYIIIKMATYTKNINLSDFSAGSCWVSPSFLDHKYYTTNNKKPTKSEDKSPKTISKMLAKKMNRYLTKKHKSNIERKTSEYNI